MKSYLFLFGRTPALSLLELQTFFPKTISLNDALGYVEADALFPIDTLGGTIKIAEVIAEVYNVTPEILTQYLTGSRNYGVSSYTDTVKISRNFLEHIKQLIGGRFVENLTSVLITKQHVTELIIVKKDTMFLIGKTIAVQDFEAWNKRDYGRPYADPKAGMLPPKVARMAVNIAGMRGTLLDTFCGMGTILGEALLTGWNVIGSDQSESTVEKAKKNLEWLASPGTWKLFVSDATHISEKLEKYSIDAIVTEPFMGDPNVSSRGRWASGPKNIIKGLEKLYIGCLKDWAKVLKPGGKVVIALPEYSVAGKTYFVKKVIDNCESLGYTVLTGPIEYSRPQAIVKREFFVLNKN